MFGFVKQQTEKPKQIEFWFVLVQTEKKIKGFEDPLIENIFWRFFRFFSSKFCLVPMFGYRSETPKQIEENVFWFRGTNRKTTDTDVSFGLFRFEPKIFFYCFEDNLLESKVQI